MKIYLLFFCLIFLFSQETDKTLENKTEKKKRDNKKSYTRKQTKR